MSLFKKTNKESERCCKNLLTTVGKTDKEAKLEFPDELANEELTLEALKVVFSNLDTCFGVLATFTLSINVCIYFIFSCKRLYDLRFLILRNAKFSEKTTNKVIEYGRHQMIRWSRPAQIFFDPEAYLNSMTNRRDALSTYNFSKERFERISKAIWNFKEVLSDLSLFSSKKLKISNTRIQTLSVFKNSYSLRLEASKIINIDPPENVRALCLKNFNRTCSCADIHHILVEARLENIKFLKITSQWFPHDFLFILDRFEKTGTEADDLEDYAPHLEDLVDIEEIDFGDDEDVQDYLNWIIPNEIGLPGSLILPKRSFLPERLRSLTTLMIFGHPDYFQSLPEGLLELENLQKVEFRACMLRHEEIKNLGNIRKLKLSDVKILYPPDLTLPRELPLFSLVNLKSLYLDMGGMENLPTLPSLETLTLRHTSIKLIFGLSFPKLKKLTLKSLTNLEHLEYFPELEMLTVCTCPKLVTLSLFPKLTNMSICHCPVVQTLSDLQAPLLTYFICRLVLTKKLENFLNVEYFDIQSSGITSIVNFPKLLRLKASLSSLEVLEKVPSLQRACFRESTFEISKYKYLLDPKIKLDLKGLDDTGSGPSGRLKGKRGKAKVSKRKARN